MKNAKNTTAAAGTIDDPNKTEETDEITVENSQNNAALIEGFR